MNNEVFKFYQVGGTVRDELMGVQSKDIDYTCVYQPYNPEIHGQINPEMVFETLLTVLKFEGFKIHLPVPECYTIRARFPEGYKFQGDADFVLARKEIGYEEGTRRPIVVPGSLHDDLVRRDFTVNAIAKDEDGNYIDPFNGQKDIKDRILRTPISGEVTFEDDPLRILRAIRFAITKQFTIATDIWDIIQNFDYPSKFSVVSVERIRDELFKCFKADTWMTLKYLEKFPELKDYIFMSTDLWLEPTLKHR